MIDLSKEWTGEDVRELCDRHNLTIQALADFMGVRRATVSDWIHGRRGITRITSMLLTYLELDLDGRLRVTKKK